jgi:pantothenate kinase
MEECSAAVLSARVKALVAERADGEKTWIALAGAPGSGKTTLSAQLSEALNRDGVPTVVMPMDGFHYYRKELDMMPDPQVPARLLTQPHFHIPTINLPRT